MNMIQNAKDQVLDLTVSAYQKAAAEGLLPQDAAGQLPDRQHRGRLRYPL